MALVDQLRILASDTPDGKPVPGEKLGSEVTMPVDGTNRVFRLKSYPLVGANASAGSVYVTILGTGAVFRSQTGFTITDYVNGFITFTVAPNPGTAGPNDGLYVDYNYNWFNDAKYTEFLNEGAQNLQLDAAVDPTKVPSGLVPALLQYALGSFFRARAAQYADRYPSSGGEAGQNVQTVPQGYRAMANDCMKRGDSLRDDYYKRQGQRLAPAWASNRTYPPPAIDPITPPR